jgi:hypothetical protein
MLKQIKARYFNRVSLVATDAEGKVVGFQLAREIHWHEEQQIELAYAGVARSFGNGGIFRRLIEAMKRHKLPLVAEVKADNKSNMRARLIRYGFQCSGEIEFQWRQDTGISDVLAAPHRLSGCHDCDISPPAAAAPVDASGAQPERRSGDEAADERPRLQTPGIPAVLACSRLLSCRLSESVPLCLLRMTRPPSGRK